MEKPKIKLDIVSDVVCPWCYIGKRRVEKAMAELADEFDFEVRYLPFELNPIIPATGVNQKEYLTAKFGGPAQYEKITRHVTDVAAGEGLAFDFERQHVAPNTRQAHRVIWLAGREGAQARVKEALMKAYFEQGVDLSQAENLAAIATGAGLPAERVKNFLNTDEGAREVAALEVIHPQRGITAVPFYIVNDRVGISGAQTPDVFVRAFREISAQKA